MVTDPAGIAIFILLNQFHRNVLFVPALTHEELIDLVGNLLAVFHGVDYVQAAVAEVAAGEYTLVRRSVPFRQADAFRQDIHGANLANGHNECVTWFR